MNRITAIEQQKKDGSRVSVFVDGEFRIGCSAKRVGEFDLKIGRTLDDETLAAIETAEELNEAKAAALRLLGRRARTVKDIQTRLQKKQFAEHTIGQVVAWLTDLGYLDDRQYAADRIDSLLRSKKMGRYGLIAKLVSDGCNRDLAEDMVGVALSSIDETEWAIEVAREKARSGQGKDWQATKRRIVGLLQRRGFDSEHIYAALEAVEPPEET